MASEVAGFTPEHEVQGSKRSRILCIILCVTAITLVGLAIAVTLVITYAPVAPARERSSSANLRSCSLSDGPNNQYDCIFDPTWVYDVCSAQKDDWGYRLNSPCFLLVFNEHNSITGHVVRYSNGSQRGVEAPCPEQ
ncbi:hypothetical protein GWK47_033989 [Chionoecetes opilio]|uniref:Uncharacterized protein n=1 Tax=Chionoecetes opilio TaxID=41210 RepID=A0A8J4YGI5_CHIOP|nr:hypothetical protein GWK47_033989 [Chionoecetes opilio]